MVEDMAILRNYLEDTIILAMAGPMELPTEAGASLLVVKLYRLQEVNSFIIVEPNFRPFRPYPRKFSCHLAFSLLSVY
jgi:hypothetical protein